jgi:putative hemolysin
MINLSRSSVIKLIPILCLLFFLSCQKESSTKTEEAKAIKSLYGKVPNPASLYCKELGYKSELRADASGNQYEVCIFPDGSECRSWDFLRAKCGQKFTFCEQQGFRIENRVEDKKTWKMEYAVCVFPDGSERPEWEFFQEKRKKESEE